MPGSAPLAAPLTFSPCVKDYMWGGRRLGPLTGRTLPSEIVAETWEISGHPAGPSVVDSGPLEGRDLPSLVAEYGAALVGRRGVEAGAAAGATGAFPLLVKLLDANHALSVQVHPGDDHAAERGLGEPGKTEMWYILEAGPGARIIHGLQPGTDREALRSAALEGRLQDRLRRLAVRPGDAVMVPAGTVHGILSGIVLVEVQQSADTTYRIHDWGRTGPDGRPRELHIGRAMEVIDFGGPGPGVVEPRAVEAGPGVRREVIAECDKFVVERLAVRAGAEFGMILGGETFEAWGVVAGEAVFAAQGSPPLGVGAVGFALLPAAMGPCRVGAAADSVLLRSYLP
ncbi:MAG: class I mannose-6-phosphate isomerase [Gemmatimonadota bacterium]|nr:class I mannose-6-phosphate isomerase [Gemmatimonadota bacterium]